jgi:hypothetical protein
MPRPESVSQCSPRQRDYLKQRSMMERSMVARMAAAAKKQSRSTQGEKDERGTIQPPAPG